jgi:hypothetical protein
MADLPDSVHTLERELRGVFGPRLQSLVVYGLRSQAEAAPHGDHADAAPTRSMALVASLTEQDLRACAARASSWHAAGLATPLVVAARELARSLDAFPLEFAAIAADHVLVSGDEPFAAVSVDPADVRRACEVQARSHLLHLREGFVDAGGNGHALAVLIVQSAAPLAALVTSLARLDGRADVHAEAAGRHAEHALGLTGSAIADVVKLAHVQEISAADAERIFPTYLAAMERLVDYVDGWGAQ